MTKKIKEHIYFVKGTHCASCEILIEKKLLALETIEAVEASSAKGEVLIEYEGDKPSPSKLNEMFRKEGYVFSDSQAGLPRQNEAKAGQSKDIVINFDLKNVFFTLGIGLLVIVGFLGLNKLGLSGAISVNSKSSLIAFFTLGLLAGVSSCAALVGGLILSMSKQWNDLYSVRDSFSRRIQPHLMFNIGRLVAYGVLGALLGALGSKINLSLKFGPSLVIIISVMMIFLALQMLGFKAFRRFQFTMPKFITKYAANESNFKGKYMPFVMGAFTFFLPCGFTVTAQGLALISGNAIQGGLIMFLFALGTLPGLLTIGLSSAKFSHKPGLSNRFLKVAGILVLFFAIYNINFQLNVLNLPNFSNLKLNSGGAASAAVKGLPPIVNGKQVIKMDASSRGYSPNYLKVKVGVPVRWEITDKGTSGCTNAIISKSLFDGQIKLTPGQVSVKEFTPSKTGKYKFSCWMGMVSGVIEVVDPARSGASGGGSNGDNNVAVANSDIVPSGSTGCGCGGGGGSSCGGR